MRVNEFSYDLPAELIADYPSARRSESRLLCLDSVNGTIFHRQFPELMKYIRPGDLLVFNDTKVCLLYTSPSPRDVEESRMPSSA